MADNLGNQGGIGDFLQGIGKFSEGTEVFKTAAGKLTFGFGMFNSAVKNLDFSKFDSLGKIIVDLTGVLRDLPEIFTKSKLVDVVARLGLELQDASRSISGSFGIMGKSNREMVKSATTISKGLAKYGITIADVLESQIALSRLAGTRITDENLIGTTARLARDEFLGLGQDAAQVTYALSTAGGMATEFIGTFADQMQSAFVRAGLQISDLGDSMRGSTNVMARLNLNTEEGAKKLSSMSLAAAKMGTTVDSLLESMEQYRGITGAVSGAALAARYGLRISPTQLMSASRGGDPTQLATIIMQRLKGYTNEKGTLDPSVGVDMARGLGQLIGMDLNQIQTALWRMNMTGESSADAFASMAERQFKQQRVMEKIENALYSVALILEPVLTPMVSILNKIAESTVASVSLLAAILLISKREAITGFVGRVRSAGGIGAFTKGAISNKMEAVRSIVRPGSVSSMPPADFGDGLTKSQKATRISDQTKLINAQSKSAASSAKLMKAQAGNMLSSAVAMVAFAGSMWILSKAFKGFQGLNWKEISQGIIVMGSMVGAMKLISMIGQVDWKSVLSMSGAIALLGGAMFIMAKPLEILSKLDLVKVAGGMTLLAGSMLAFMGIGALGMASGGIGVAAWAIGLGMVASSIALIGKAAEIASQPIYLLGSGFEKMANAMVTLSNVEPAKINSNIKAIDMEGLSKNISQFAEVSANVGNKEVTIQNHIRLDIDGKKFMDKIVESRGR